MFRVIVMLDFSRGALGFGRGFLTLFGLALLAAGGWVKAEPPPGGKLTAFDAYIAKPDASYRWEVAKTIDSGNLKGAMIRLTSQTWRTTEDVDKPLWEHWLTVAIPSEVKTDRVFLFIGGGSHDTNPPKGIDTIISTIAQSTGSIVAELKNIPNQPLVFHQDGTPRKEDDLIGYCWSQFLESGDPTWLPRFPMVKSVVRAMDCIQEFSKSEAGGKHAVSRFIVGGGSKRGWTTWLSGAADDRIEAIVPIVIDVANAGPSLKHHAEVYGFWSEAIGNYYQHNILQRFDHPRMKDLYALVDPYSYRDRLTLPKYIVNASGDQFFLPDSSQFYYDELKGKKLLRYVPNADHGLKNSDAVQSVAAFHEAVFAKKELPEYSWKFLDNGAIEVRPSGRPLSVTLWRANNPKARDFRLMTIGPAFQSTVLAPQADGSYLAPPPSDQPGWTASFVELTYDLECVYPLKVSTGVLVTPKEKPFAGINLVEVPYEPLMEKKDPVGK